VLKTEKEELVWIEEDGKLKDDELVVTDGGGADPKSPNPSSSSSSSSNMLVEEDATGGGGGGGRGRGEINGLGVVDFGGGGKEKDGVRDGLDRVGERGLAELGRMEGGRRGWVGAAPNESPVEDRT